VTITLDENIRSPNSSSSKGFSVALKSNKRTVDASKQLGFSDEPEEDTVVPKKRVLSSLDDEIARRAKEDDARAQARTLIEQIPVEKDELFNFTIDWKLVDEKHIIEQKIRPWIVKKIVELLGEEEPTLIEYLCKKLQDHTPPQQILEQLQLVLEDEATSFVIKMWRSLIFHMMIG
jgi:RNA-binding protein 25